MAELVVVDVEVVSATVRIFTVDGETLNADWTELVNTEVAATVKSLFDKPFTI